MIGTSGKGMVLQDRDRHLLREIALMRVVDREQARRVAPFGSVTRANHRLQGLTRAGLLQRFFLGTEAGGKKALYMLSPSGAKLVGVTAIGPRRKRDTFVAADQFVAHQSFVNELYCDFKYGSTVPNRLGFERWLTFTKPFDSAIPLIPDGYVDCEGPGSLSAFIEVDLAHERLSVWQGKVRHYLQYAASGRFEGQFGKKRFLVLAICESRGRMESLRHATAGLTEKIFRFATFPSIKQHGLWPPIWFKPVGDNPHALIETT